MPLLEDEEYFFAGYEKWRCDGESQAAEDLRNQGERFERIRKYLKDLSEPKVKMDIVV